MIKIGAALFTLVVEPLFPLSLRAQERRDLPPSANSLQAVVPIPETSHARQNSASAILVSQNQQSVSASAPVSDPVIEAPSTPANPSAPRQVGGLDKWVGSTSTP